MTDHTSAEREAFEAEASTYTKFPETYDHLPIPWEMWQAACAWQRAALSAPRGEALGPVAIEDPLRIGVHALLTMLENGEYAEHWAKMTGGDPLAQRLEEAITDLHSELSDAMDGPSTIAPPASTSAASPATRAEPVALTNEHKELVCNAIAEALGDAYDCDRVWSAWNVGTMRQDDFYPVADSPERVAEIADAAIKSILAAPSVDAQAAVAEGWKLVPHEPTKEMLEAGREQWHRVGTTTDAWQAMFCAAPAQPTDKEKGK